MDSGLALRVPRNDTEEIAGKERGETAAACAFRTTSDSFLIRSSSRSIQRKPSIWRKPRRTAQYLPSVSSSVLSAKLWETSMLRISTPFLRASPTICAGA